MTRPLTTREADVLRFKLTEGRRLPEIARALGTTEPDVRNTLARALRALGATSLDHALQLLHPPEHDVRAEASAPDRGPAPRTRLTDRERKVMVGIANGRPVRRIAAELGIAPETVRNDAARARRRLAAGTDAQAVALLVALRQIDLHELDFPMELLVAVEVGAASQVSGGAVAA